MYIVLALYECVFLIWKTFHGLFRTDRYLHNAQFSNSSNSKFYDDHDKSYLC